MKLYLRLKAKYHTMHGGKNFYTFSCIECTYDFTWKLFPSNRNIWSPKSFSEQQLAEIKAHLLTHNVISCEQCGSLIKANTQKTHKKGVRCVEDARENWMENEGYVECPVLINYLSDHFESKGKELLQSLTWNNQEDILSVEDVLKAEYKTFLDSFGVFPALSHYNQKSGKWEIASWFPAELSHLIDILLQVRKLEDAKTNLSYWKQGKFGSKEFDIVIEYVNTKTAEDRDAIIGFLELQLEGL